MINYFPNPYPDELWYSVICRYHIWSGNIDPINTIRELFYNKEYVDVGTSFPSNSIYKIGSQLTALNIEKIATEHTLFKYAYRLYPLNEKYKMLEMIKSGNIQWPGKLCIYHTEKPKLKYCPLCLKEDTQKYGEPYWHVSHQIPVIQICKKHKCRLLTYQCSGYKDLDMGLISPLKCNDIEINYEIKNYEILIYDYAMKYLLFPLDIGPNFNFNNLYEGLYNNGYGLFRKDNGYILNINKISKDIIEKFDQNFIEYFFLRNNINDKILQGLKKWQMRSPERYIILSALIEQDPEITFSNEKIKNNLYLRLLNLEKTFNGETKKILADKIGVRDYMLDSICSFYNIKPFWKKEKQTKKYLMTFKVSQDEKKKIYEYMNKHQFKYFNDFIRTCINDKISHNNKKEINKE